MSTFGHLRHDSPFTTMTMMHIKQSLSPSSPGLYVAETIKRLAILGYSTRKVSDLDMKITANERRLTKLFMSAYHLNFERIVL